MQWPNDTLEPVLITYNRARDVKRTLESFAKAGLFTMRLHVLDNASTDNTAEVVKEYQRGWPELRYHRNKYNIGGNGNILRAVEVADSVYHWVIGDDDAWQLDDIGMRELISVLENEAADIVRLGWLVSDDSRGRAISASELASNEPFFFASVSMISATIIRREIVAKYLAHAYLNIGDVYPQLVPVMKGVEGDPLTVYTLSRDIMNHTPSEGPGYFFGDLEWYTGWFRSGRFLGQPTLRAKYVDEVMRYMTRDKPGGLHQFSLLAKTALRFKALGIDQTKSLLSMLAYGDGWRGKLTLMFLLYLAVPKWLLARLAGFYYRTVHGIPFDDGSVQTRVRQRESRL